MRVVADERTRAHVAGAQCVYVRPRTQRCCGGNRHVLEVSDAPDAERYVERGRVEDTRILVRAGLRLPDELHLEVDRRGRLHAFWNGQGWIG